MNTENRYAALLAEHQPRPIHSAEEHTVALKRYEDRMRAFDREPSAELGAVMQLAAMTIEAYERDHHPHSDLAPAQLVAHLLEARGMNQSQLAGPDPRHPRPGDTPVNRSVDRRPRGRSVSGSYASQARTIRPRVVPNRGWPILAESSA